MLQASSRSAITIAGAVLVLFLAASFTNVVHATPSKGAGTTDFRAEGAGSDLEDKLTVLLAAKAKKKQRRQRRRLMEDEAGVPPNDKAFGRTVHGKQEGIDKPYRAVFAPSVSISTTSSTYESDGEKEDPTKAASYAFSVSYLFLISSFAVGPNISYSQQQQSTPGYESVDGEFTKVTRKSKSATQSLGVSTVYYFGNLDQDLLLPFGRFDLSMTQSKADGDDQDSYSSKGNLLGLSAGALYFIDSNVGIETALTYSMSNSEDNRDPKTKIEFKGTYLSLGLAVFI